MTGCAGLKHALDLIESAVLPAELRTQSFGEADDGLIHIFVSKKARSAVASFTAKWLGHHTAYCEDPTSEGGVEWLKKYAGQVNMVRDRAPAAPAIGRERCGHRRVL